MFYHFLAPEGGTLHGRHISLKKYQDEVPLFKLNQQRYVMLFQKLQQIYFHLKNLICFSVCLLLTNHNHFTT